MDEVQVVRSGRKTVSITIRPDGGILVRAPEKMRAEQIKRFLLEHREWIRKKQELVEEHLRMRKTFEKKYISGEKFLYLGQEYILDVVAVPGRKRAGAEVIADTLTVEIGTAEERTGQEFREVTEAAVRRWYKEEARKRFDERAAFFAEYMGVVYGQIRVKEQKTRWGSCSGRGNLNFNWKLVMAPPEILDYVVVHELCHLKEMNHSRRFWQTVERVLPDYRECRNWLKVHGEELTLNQVKE